jgi:UrcA family protein
MTRPNSVFVLRRTSEHVAAGAAALGATLLMLFTVDVRAAEAANPPQVSVSYSETAFATEKGAANVYRKLKSAARKVCGLEAGSPLSLSERTRAEKCVDTALADAVSRIDRPMLTSVHAHSARELG